MGRKRLSNHDLPPRVYFHHGAYYYRPASASGPTNKRIRLGADHAEAMENYRKINSLGTPNSVTLREDVAHMLYIRAKRGAEERSIEFNLTRNDIFHLLQNANGQCQLSGIIFSDEIAHNGKRPWAPSIDRINSKRGYDLDNVRIVCVAVNIALSDFGDDILAKIARGICANIPQSNFMPHTLADTLAETM